MDINSFIESVEDEYTGTYKMFSDVPTDKRSLKLDLVILTENGTFVIMKKDEEWRSDIKDINTAFHLGMAGYFFLYDEDAVSFYDGENLISLKEEYEFANFVCILDAVTGGYYTQGSRARHNYDITLEDILNGYEVAISDVKPVYSEYTMDMISELFEKRFEEDATKKAGRRKEKTVDGITYVRRLTTTGKEEWCMVDDTVDPDAHLTKAALFGFLGIHKFAEGKIGSGLLYILSFGGCFNILPISDAIAILAGSYRLKNGDYLEHIKNVKAALLKLLGGVLIGVALFFATRLTLQQGTLFLAEKVTDSITVDTENMTEEEQIEYYTDILENFGISTDDIETLLDSIDEETTEEELEEMLGE